MYYILEGKVGMKRRRGIPGLPQIIKDLGCGTFREGKQLAWDRVDGVEGCSKPVLGSNTL